MNKPIKKPALLALLILALSITAVAQPARGVRANREAPMQNMEELNLSADQEQKMKDLRFKHEASMIDLKAELQTERLKLKQLKQADEPNKKKLHAQIDKVGAVEIKIAKIRADHRLAVRGILTTEQLKTFKREMPNRAGNFGRQDENCRDKRPRHRGHNRF